MATFQPNEALDARALELAETWINGNHADAVAGVKGSPALALKVREVLADLDPTASSAFVQRMVRRAVRQGR